MKELRPLEILANPQNLECPCEDTTCQWHGKCKDCTTLHRYYKTIPNCLLDCITNDINKNRCY